MKIRLPAEQGARIAARIVEIIEAAPRNANGAVSAEGAQIVADTVERELGKDLADLIRAREPLEFELDYSPNAAALA